MKLKFIFAAAALAAIVSSCADSNKASLFNGKDLNGWVCVVDSASDVPTSEVFGVVDGNIRIEGNPFGYMRTHKKYGDYRLHVEWRWIGEGTNSGIFQRVQGDDKVWPTAVECQLKAGRAGDFVMLGGMLAGHEESGGSVVEENGEVLKKMVFMPVVHLNKEGAEKIIDDYIKYLKPKAFELVFKEENPDVLRLIKKVKDSGSKIFINTLWPDLCAGHDDDRAIELGEPEESWGWVIEQGATYIQTDRPALLLEYLRFNRLHR